jgi:hypothetical protein
VNIPHVFAKANGVAGVDFGDRFIPGGSHWPADDPLVVARPDLFTADCRYGLMFSGDPPEYMSVPPDEDVPHRGPGRPRKLVPAHGTGGPA